MDRTGRSQALHRVPRRRRRGGLSVTAAGAAGLVVAAALQAPASAAEPAVFATGVTGPASVLRLGNATDGFTTWVSDHLQGFCRIDAGRLVPTTCVNGEAAPGGAPVSPGQGSYDPVTDRVYLPDNSAASEGVYRLSYDPVAKTVSGGGLMGSGLAGIRTSSTALVGSTLYVGALRSSTVYKIDTTNLLAPAQAHGQTSDGGGAESIAANGSMLYLAEGEGISTLSADTGGTASLHLNPAIEAPGPIGSDGTHLYVATVDELTGAGELVRWNHTTGVTDVFSDEAGGFPSAVGFAPGTVYVGEDSSEGAFIAQGTVLSYATADAPEEAAVATVPLPGASTGGGGGGGATPPPADGTTVATLLDDGAYNTRGAVRLGSDLWVGDATAGLCKVVPGGALSSCVSGLSQVGQPSVSTSTGTTYVLVPHSAGVRRLTWDPNTGTLGGSVALGGGRLTDAMTATALSADGRSVYAAGANTGLVKASVVTQGARPTTVARLAADVNGLARVGSDLYAAQTAAVRLVGNVDACTGKCTDQATAASISNPRSISSDGSRLLFLSSGGVVQRFDLTTGDIHDRYVTTWASNPTDLAARSGFTTVTGTAVDGSSLVVADSRGLYTASTTPPTPATTP